MKIYGLINEENLRNILPVFRLQFVGTIASKINDTPKGTYLPISKLHSILAVANLLAKNKKKFKFVTAVKFHYRVLQFTDNLTPLGVTFILLAMVHSKCMLQFYK